MHAHMHMRAHTRAYAHMHTVMIAGWMSDARMASSTCMSKLSRSMDKSVHVGGIHACTCMSKLSRSMDKSVHVCGRPHGRVHVHMHACPRGRPHGRVHVHENISIYMHGLTM